ncbi:MAG: class E sortase [Jatrophihabitantaceae bacterium]
MSEDTVVDDPPPPPPIDPPAGGGALPPSGRPRQPRGVGDVIRFLLRGVGQTLITAGLVVLLFVVYQVYVTNYFSQRAQDKVHTALEKQWANDTLALPTSKIATADGKGLANLYIPRFGNDYAETIVAGTGASSLEKGPGHYDGTQLPGQPGDFAIAGHRVGKGEPFLNLDKIQAGDSVVVETQTDWFLYCVIGAATPANACNPNAPGGNLDRTDKNGVPGREVVTPSQGEVVLPVPSRPNAPMPYTTAYLTMTTCHPKFVANKRLIIHAVLARTIAKTKDTDGAYSTVKPAAITALYTQIGN